MKDTKSINGGNFLDQYANNCTSAIILYNTFSEPYLYHLPGLVANYLFKSAQAWKNKGSPVFAISILVNNSSKYASPLASNLAHLFDPKTLEF